MSDYTYDDCRLLWRAKQLNMPHATSLVEAQKLRQTLGYLFSSYCGIKLEIDM